MKAFAIATQTNGIPNISSLPFAGWTQCGRVGTFAAYLFSGTGPQLIAINALSNVYGLVAMTESGSIRWAELDGTVTTAQRTKWNAWLSARGYPTIPVGWSYRQIVLAVFKRLNNLFDLTTHDILDSA